MPSDLKSIADGANLKVGAQLAGLVSSSSASVNMSTAVPISGSLNSSISSSFTLSDSDESIATSSSSDDEDASSVASLSSDGEEEEEAYPPSPPIKTMPLKTASVSKFAADMTVPSPASYSGSVDYFSTKTHNQKTFLQSVFPRSKILDRALTIESDSAIWNLALFDEGVDGKRTLYARGSGGFEVMNLRENLVSLLDRADEELDCDQVVVVLEKKDKNLASILHSLMYVGGVVIPSTASNIHKKHSSSCVLVGIEV